METDDVTYRHDISREKIASIFPWGKDRKYIHLHLTAHMGNKG